MKELDAIGFLELNSIAKGIEAVDTMLKAADLQLIMAKASCPGKYYLMISGQVGAVERGMDVGRELGERYVVGDLVIPRIHPSVIRGINMTTVPKAVQALGVIEYYSAAGSIIAADYAVKAADIDILSLQLGTGIAGKSYVVLSGDISSVKTAVEAGVKGAANDAILINKLVLANPEQALIDSLIH